MKDLTTTSATDTENGGKKTQKFYETWSFLIVICVIVPIIIRSFIFTPFHIPSGSMKPGLLIGDYIFVSKSAYGYSRFSFPLAPNLFEGRVLANEPKRGDVVVFRLPTNHALDYIKRLIGLPGDRIQVRGGVVFLNGTPIERKADGNWTEKDERGREKTYRRYIETLPNGVSYVTLDEAPGQALDDTPEYIVPDGHYFFMGDNRDNSQDSRVLGVVGYVPAENLVGHATTIFVSADAPFYLIWKWVANIRTDRFFKPIK